MHHPTPMVRFRRACLRLLLAPGLALPGLVAAAPGTPAITDSPQVVQIRPVAPCDWDGQGADCTLRHPFDPPIVVIRAGETIEWWAAEVGGHTVTVPAVGMSAPSLFIQHTLEDGSRLWRLNPLAGAAQGGRDYDGTALAGSGVILDDGAPYRLTFTEPGHYNYVDLAQPALAGQVIVLAATAGGPPDRRDE